MVLTHYGLDGTTVLGTVSLSNTAFTVNGTSVSLNFGAGGIGGSENLADLTGNWAALIADDGIYKLTIDPDGTGQHDITETFYRMFGDVIGNTAGGATVTGGTTGIGAVSASDVTAINTALSNGNPGAMTVNGGTLCANDRTVSPSRAAATLPRASPLTTELVYLGLVMCRGEKRTFVRFGLEVVILFAV